MRSVVRLAILLYVSLLCSIQPGHAYDTRLSPLADNPFYAVSPELNSSIAEAITEPNPDHEPALLNANKPDLSLLATLLGTHLVYNYASQFNLTTYARGPPVFPND